MRFIAVVFLSLALLCMPQTVLADMTVNLDWEMANRYNDLTVSVDGEVGQGFGVKLGVGAAGSMEGPENFATRVTEFGGSYSIGTFKVFGGLISHSVGRAKIHPTFLAPNTSAFPNVGYEISGKNWSYMKLHGDLRNPRRELFPGEEQETYKRLGLHYLSFTPWEPLSIGLGEALVFTESFDGDLFYNSLPFLPYYFAKYFPGIKSAADNSLFYGDGQLKLPIATLYGELLVNEFPMSPGAGNPKLFAITLGAETDELIPNWNLLAEYTYFTDRAYSNGNEDAVYSIGDKSLGHPLGDDFTGFDIQASRYWDSIQSETTFGVYHLRLGDTAVRPWSKRSEDLVEEKVYGVKLEAKHWRDNLELGAHLDVGYVTDYKHQPGETGFKHNFVLSATWHL